MGGTIFASADVATLVANFQPVSLNPQRPLLLRSASGNAMINLATTSLRLDKLLRTSISRLRKSDLTSFLGIESGSEQQVLDEATVPLYESLNRRELIPVGEGEAIRDDLTRLAGISFPELNAYSKTKDVHIHSLKKILEHAAEVNWQLISGHGQSFVIQEQKLQAVKSEIQTAVGHAGLDIYDLSDRIPTDFPSLLLQHIANELDLSSAGEVRLENDHYVFVPSGYSHATANNAQENHHDRGKELAELLDARGYCVCTSDSLASLSDENENEYTAHQAILRDVQNCSIWDITVITTTDGNDSQNNATNRHITSLLILSTTLLQEMDFLRTKVADHAEKLWRNKDKTSSLKSVMQELSRGQLVFPDSNEIETYLLRSDKTEELHTAACERIGALEHHEQRQFAQLLELRLLTPFDLYKTGLATINDTTLKKHLGEFIADHFRREVVPEVMKAIHEQDLLHEKDRERQVNKYKQAIADSKSMEEVQSASTRMAKKLKVEIPGEEVIETAKEQSLQAAVKSMRQMKRGSDVLQNLIWILLARRRDGLFMSSGKDTSRMIKQYEAVGDADVATKLVGWRDLLKGGQETREDVQEMREMAMRAVDEGLEGSGS